MGKILKALDKVTLESRLNKTNITPPECIAHETEINYLEKDLSGRSLFLGKIHRYFHIKDHGNIKFMTLTIEFRPICDTEERLDAQVHVKLLRKDRCVEKKTYLKTIVGKIPANTTSSFTLKLTDRRTFGLRNLEAGDILEVTLDIKNKQNNKVYFSNMYIKKECKHEEAIKKI